MTERKRLFVVTPWKRRWELGNTAGVADDYYFIREFTRQGYEVHYVGPRDKNPPDVNLDEYFVHDFPDVLTATEHWPSLVRRPMWPILFTTYAVRRAMQVARQFPPSAVLGQTHLSAWAVRRLARRLQVPSVVKLFGVFDLDRHDWPRWKYLRKNAEQILAFKVPQDAWFILDDGTGGEAAALQHGVPRERVHGLPNGINIEWSEHVASQNVLDQYSISREVDNVLFMARIIEWKRPQLFVRAAPEILRRAERPVRFLMAGDGALRGECERLARELGVESAMQFLGAVPHNHVPHILSATSVFASTNRLTNQGIPTCEALVCGVPVVAFDVGATRTVVRDGETGCLVPDADVGALSEAVADLLNDRRKRESIGRRARAFAQQHFMGWAERVGREIDIVEGLIARR